MNRKLVGILGIFAAIIPMAAIFTSIVLSPWFTWTGSWLSDLGGATNPAAPIFNIGLVIGGILGMLFTYGLWELKMFKGDQGDFGLAFLLLSSIFLFFVGFFPVDAGMPHTLASLLFFIFSIPTLILLGNVIRKSVGPGERMR
jgi:hypothetical membrane protein